MRWLFLFTISLVIFGAPVFVWWQVENEKRRQRVVKSLASTIDPDTPEVRTTVLMEKPARKAGLAGLFQTGLFHKDNPAPGADVVEIGYSQGKLLLLTLGCAFLGLLVGTKFTGLVGPFAPLMVGSACGAIPWIYRGKQRSKRIAIMEEQFPDALDFLARSVRAGNAFSIGLELLAAEATEPLKSEFLKLTREMALGAGLDDALQGLIARVPIFEVRFFVAAVLLQRETGGNLSEILAKLANAIRERMRLRGQVKSASGQGRLTAKVLSVLPLATMIMLRIVSPVYLDALTNDPLGRSLLAAAVVSQVLGYFAMQKIAKIEV